MKFKKLVFILFLFLSIDMKVEAKDEDCPYIETKSREEITTIINLSGEDQLAPITIDNQTVYYGNNNSQVFGISMPTNYFINKDYNFVQDYYDDMQSCPPYFYVYSNEYGIYYGFFSDFPNNKLTPKPKYSFESTAQEVEVDEEGSYVAKDERYSCAISSSNVKNFKLGIEINYTDKSIKFSSGIFENKDSYIKNFDYNNKEICPDDLIVCYDKDTDSASRQFYIESKKDKVYSQIIEYACYDLSEFNELDVGTKGCNLYLNLIIDYKNSYSNEDYQNANSILSTLKNFCSAQLMYENYDSYEYSCINLCLNISDDIVNIDLKSDGNCGFSWNLIKWISNIVKWLKYIIPVIVIVLGIIDFIRAIESDKDDEMKKAQGRFIKRLIVAALIFIVPFIIEFVLDKMGFAANGCGIIDL